MVLEARVIDELLDQRLACGKSLKTKMSKQWTSVSAGIPPLTVGPVFSFWRFKWVRGWLVQVLGNVWMSERL